MASTIIRFSDQPSMASATAEYMMLGTDYQTYQNYLKNQYKPAVSSAYKQNLGALSGIQSQVVESKKAAQADISSAYSQYLQAQLALQKNQNLMAGYKANISEAYKNAMEQTKYASANAMSDINAAGQSAVAQQLSNWDTVKGKYTEALYNQYSDIEKSLADYTKRTSGVFDAALEAIYASTEGDQLLRDKYFKTTKGVNGDSIIELTDEGNKALFKEAGEAGANEWDFSDFGKQLLAEYAANGDIESFYKLANKGDWDADIAGSMYNTILGEGWEDKRDSSTETRSLSQQMWDNLNLTSDGTANGKSVTVHADTKVEGKDRHSTFMGMMEESGHEGATFTVYDKAGLGYTDTKFDREAGKIATDAGYVKNGEVEDYVRSEMDADEQAINKFIQENSGEDGKALYGKVITVGGITYMIGPKGNIRGGVDRTYYSDKAKSKFGEQPNAIPKNKYTFAPTNATGSWLDLGGLHTQITKAGYEYDNNTKTYTSSDGSTISDDQYWNIRSSILSDYENAKKQGTFDEMKDLKNHTYTYGGVAIKKTKAGFKVYIDYSKYI